MWEVRNEQIVQGDNKWETNKYEPNVDVSNVSRIDVRLYGRLDVWTGYFDTHFAKMLITFEYVPEVPPEPATVKIYVYDRQTNKPIGGALVQILSGNKIIAEGYTRSDGWVVFNNVPAGFEGISYTLLVTKSGYHDYSDSIDVVPGTNEFRVALTPIPSPPIPWNWIIGGAAVIVIGGTAMALMGRKSREIVVVR